MAVYELKKHIRVFEMAYAIRINHVNYTLRHYPNGISNMLVVIPPSLFINVPNTMLSDQIRVYLSNIFKKARVIKGDKILEHGIKFLNM